MLSIEQLEKELKTNDLSGGIYLLYGEETFLLESNLKKIKSLFGQTIKGINEINENARQKHGCKHAFILEKAGKFLF